MCDQRCGPTYKKEPMTPTRPWITPDSDARKDIPLASGVLDYFPNALAEVAKLSKVGNDKHNPGQPLHWSRGKSNDHADTIMRHLVQRGTVDTDGLLHDVKVAWRALAMLEEALIARGATPGRNAMHTTADTATARMKREWPTSFPPMVPMRADRA